MIKFMPVIRYAINEATPKIGFVHARKGDNSERRIFRSVNEEVEWDRYGVVDLFDDDGRLQAIFVKGPHSWMLAWQREHRT